MAEGCDICEGNMEDEKSVWTLLEEKNTDAPEAQALYSWSLNCAAARPFTLFMDLIGYSEEHFGEALTRNYPVGGWGLGYTELAYLADALAEYADNPHGVHRWLRRLTDCVDW